MNANATQTIILGALADFGGAVLIIIGAVLAVGVGYLVFRIGWTSTKRALDAGAIEATIASGNRRYAAQLENERELALGDRVGTLDSMRR